LQLSNDEKISFIIGLEKKRQIETINLIASENYTSDAVRLATGSVLTHKYAEGYPGKRYYAGCQEVDQIELIAIDRAKKLFNMPHANVQPHSGSTANMAVYHAAIKPGDTILGMNLPEGGHLTHGHPINFSGQIYNAVSYGVDPKTHIIDYDAVERLAHAHKPKLIIAGASSYSRDIDFERFAQIAKSVDALFMADIAHIAGLIVAGLHRSPAGIADFITATTHKTLRGPRGGLILCSMEWAERIDRAVMPGVQGGPLMHVIAAKGISFYEALLPQFVMYQEQVIANAKTLSDALMVRGYDLVSNGTDNHLLVIDLQKRGITGHQAQIALERAGINTSKSCIPNDPQKPWITSGVRLGTPAVTTRGFGRKEIITIADWIDIVLTNIQNEMLLNSIRQEICAFVSQYPLFDHKQTTCESSEQSLMV